MIKKLLTWTMILALLLTAAAPALADDAPLQKGDKGDAVISLQARLIELGYLEEEANGVFDENTEAALMAFQRMNGLLATGMADRLTMEALFSEHAKKNQPMAEDAFYEEAAAGYAPGSAFLYAPLATSMTS